MTTRSEKTMASSVGQRTTGPARSTRSSTTRVTSGRSGRRRSCPNGGNLKQLPPSSLTTRAARYDDTPTAGVPIVVPKGELLADADLSVFGTTRWSGRGPQVPAGHAAERLVGSGRRSNPPLEAHRRVLRRLGSLRPRSQKRGDVVSEVGG